MSQSNNNSVALTNSVPCLYLQYAEISIFEKTKHKLRNFYVFVYVTIHAYLYFKS